MKFSTKVKAIRNSMEFSHGIRRALVGALILVYFISLGFDILAVTTLFAISTLIMTFFEFPTGAIADYDSRKKSLMISFFLISVSFLGIFLFKNFWVLAGFWILGDIAWTFSSGAGSAWAIDALNYAKKKSKIISLISKGYMFEKFGHIIGGIIGFIIVAISFKFIWLVISLNYLVLLFIIGKYMEERNFKPEKVPHNYLKKSLIKAKESFSFIVHKQNKDLRILMWSEFLLVIGFGGVFVGMPLLLTQIFGLKPEYLSVIYSMAAVLAIGGALAANKIANKYKFGKSLFMVSILFGISIISLAISKSLIFVIFSFIILQIILSTLSVIFDSARHHEFDSKIRASLGSLSSMTWAIANSIGVFFAGISINFIGVINTLLISGGAIFLISFVFLWMSK